MIRRIIDPSVSDDFIFVKSYDQKAYAIEMKDKDFLFQTSSKYKGLENVPEDLTIEGFELVHKQESNTYILDASYQTLLLKDLEIMMVEYSR